MIIIKKKLLIGITSLTLGGAERVLVDMSNKLCEKYDITIFSIYDNGELKGELDKSINFKALYDCSYAELSRVKKLLIPLKLLLLSKQVYNKKIKEDYDIEIAFLEGPVTRLICTKNPKTKKIAWVHNNIIKVYGDGLKSKIKHWIDKRIYKKYDDIVFVSQENKNDFKKLYNCFDESKLNVIYNYIDKQKVEEKAQLYSTEITNMECRKFLCVCRLVKQKAIDRLIKVHKMLLDEGLIHEFFIIGDGPEKKNLRELIMQESVQNTFHLLGKKKNPYPYIKDCDYFCLLSKYEGYGMVLEEAKILNKKIIITDTAAKECIEDYNKSIVVENNRDAIFDSLSKILKGEISIPDEEYVFNAEKRIEDIINLIEKK